MSASSVVQEFASSKDAKQEKLAIVSVGGGAKGRVEMGMYRHIHRLGLLNAADILIGTSAGGLNSIAVGASLYQRGNLDAALGVWDHIQKNSDVFKPELPSGFFGYIGAALKLNSPSLVDPAGLRGLVKNLVGEMSEGEQRARIKKQVAVVASDYITGQQVLLTGPNRLYDMAIATSAIPGVFPAHLGQFADGGLLNNNPVDFAIQLGATKVIILFCNTDADENVQADVKPFKPSLLNNGLRSIDIMMQGHEDQMWRYVNDMTKKNRELGGNQVEFFMLWPEKDSGNMLDFSTTWLLDHGDEVAQKHITEDRMKTFLLT